MLQDVDAQLQEFDTKQNIDIGLIIGGKHGAANEPIEDPMDMRQRAGNMHMGHSRSLSAGAPPPMAAMAEVPRLGFAIIGLHCQSMPGFSWSSLQPDGAGCFVAAATLSLQ